MGNEPVRVADTPALFALFSETDVHHERARAALADPESIAIPAEIFSETLALVHKRHGFAAARRAGEFLRGLPHVEVRPATPDVSEAAWDAFRSGRGRLSYPDAVVLAWARTHRMRILSFDEDLNRS